MDFDVDAFLAQSNLQPYQVHRRGHVRRGDEIFNDSGLSLDVSQADGELVEEIADAICFLATHESELQRLQSFPGVTSLRLDFGCVLRDVVAQFEYLPPALLTRAGCLGIGIELSLYHVAETPGT